MSTPTFDKSKVDYSLYLVTDNRMVPQGTTFLEQIATAINNGVTIVQLREKDTETRDFINRAHQVHKLTKKHNIPLIINDRLDVAVAVDAEGVHVGQDDMPVAEVRRILGPNKIVGLSISNVDEAKQLLEINNNDGANGKIVDYVGIGAVYSTATKNLKKLPMGPAGVREILEVFRENEEETGQVIQSVLIGGLNALNILRSLFISAIKGKAADGVAVVLCIMAAKDCALATQQTLAAVKNSGPWVSNVNLSNNDSKENIFNDTNVANAIQTAVQTTPLVHHITNSVAQNFLANVTISVGGSPIMSTCKEEYSTLGHLPNTALVLNTGTLTPEANAIYEEAIMQYNTSGNPIIYDPVGCGASPQRRFSVKAILNSSYCSVIKGNAGEILTAAEIDGALQMRGVDGASTGDDSSGQFQQILIKATKKLALAQRCVVVCTGKQDIIANGLINSINGNVNGALPTNADPQVVILEGGHDLMGQITASGCSLGSVIGAFVGAGEGKLNRKDPFFATVVACAVYKEAGYIGGRKANGPGTFIPHFIDALYQLTHDDQIKTGFSNWNVKVKLLASKTSYSTSANSSTAKKTQANIDTVSISNSTQLDHSSHLPVVLTIAGSDSSGGAGIEADIKTISQHHCYAATAINTLTAQNTTGVQEAFALPKPFFATLLKSVTSDLKLAAIKTGVLSVDAISAVNEAFENGDITAKDTKLVVDPVMVSTSGHELATSEAVQLLVQKLLPRAYLVTPNFQESLTLASVGANNAASLVANENEKNNACFENLREKTEENAIVEGLTKLARRVSIVTKAAHVLVKGGSFNISDSSNTKTSKTIVNLLYNSQTENVDVFKAPSIESQNTHGTGCTLSAAIASNLAKGLDLKKAVREAIEYVGKGIASADTEIGTGNNKPLNHMV